MKYNRIKEKFSSLQQITDYFNKTNCKIIWYNEEIITGSVNTTKYPEGKIYIVNALIEIL